MPTPDLPLVHVSCAGAIIFDDARRLLLIRRARPPSAGSWSIPGGKSLPGEATAETCVREVREETGLDVEVLHLAGRVEIEGIAGTVFDVDDYVCRVAAGELRAASDASDARWVSYAQLVGLELVGGLLEALTGWDALPG